MSSRSLAALKAMSSFPRQGIGQLMHATDFDRRGRGIPVLQMGIWQAARTDLLAATCLLPVASHLVERLPESLERVLVVLWSCLRDMKDDLSSSVGSVMDLLGMANENTCVFSLITSF